MPGPRTQLTRASVVVALAAMTAVGVAAAPSFAKARTATITGTTVRGNGAWFTIEQPGKAAGQVNKMIAYANKLAAKRYPYVYGGGHARAQVPSRGTSGQKHKGFDCSATVAAVLAAAGLWPKHSGVPSDLGVIEDLLHRKVIAKGAGTGPYSVDLFDRPNKDIQMNIDGDFFGTGYTRRGGPSWMAKNEPVRFPGYKVYHVRPGKLKNRASYSHLVTFEYARGNAGYKLMQELVNGAKVDVTYHESGGILVASGAVHIGGKPFAPPAG